MRGFKLLGFRGFGGLLVTCAFLAMGSFANVSAQPPLDPSAASDEKQPPPLSPQPQVLEAPVPGETLVWFFPTDNDATATVIYLLNTNPVAQIVRLRGYSYNGALVYSLNLSVGATGILRLASDSIAPAPPPSWVGPPTNPNGVNCAS
jgi:hypothetical protein